MTRPKELRADTIEHQARVVSGHMGWLEANAQRIAERGNSDVDEGLKGRSYEGDGRGGSDSTSTERLALAKAVDPTAPHVIAFGGLLTQLAETARQLREVGAKIMPAWDDETRPLTERRSLRDSMTAAARAEKLIGSGACRVCGSHCTGGARDRLVWSRCLTCFKYWDRHHRQEDRPRSLWGVSTDVDIESA